MDWLTYTYYPFYPTQIRPNHPFWYLLKLRYIKFESFHLYFKKNKREIETTELKRGGLEPPLNNGGQNFISFPLNKENCRKPATAVGFGVSTYAHTHSPFRVSFFMFCVFGSVLIPLAEEKDCCDGLITIWRRSVAFDLPSLHSFAALGFPGYAKPATFNLRTLFRLG